MILWALTVIKSTVHCDINYTPRGMHKGSICRSKIFMTRQHDSGALGSKATSSYSILILP